MGSHDNSNFIALNTEHQPIFDQDLHEPTTADVYLKEKSNTLSDKYWYETPAILFSKDRAIEFIPTKDMNNYEKLNAISRFFIYLGILLFLVFRNYLVLFIPIIALTLITIIWHNDATLHQENVAQFDQRVKETFGIAKDTLIDIDPLGNVCQRPNPHNPFMNVLISDYVTNPQRPPACSLTDPFINDEMTKHFEYNLYRNVDDVWDRNNSQREYYTMPSTTIPNDRETFQKWLYKLPAVCKDGDMDQCLEFDRVQQGHA
jgi:hypothetical protein